MARNRALSTLTFAVLATLLPASFVTAAERVIPNPEPGGEILHIPGLPPIQMPPTGRIDPDRDDSGRTGIDRQFGAIPDIGHRGSGRGQGDGMGSTIIGPGGVQEGPRQGRRIETPKKLPTPEEKSEAIRKALAPKPPLAFVRRHTLDDLYGKLASAKDEDEAKGLATLIGTIWMRSGSDTAALLMSRAMKSIDTKDYPLALRLLDQVVELQPSWAEAWNKRASVRYVVGDIDGSMTDVEHVLKLEPKHFGALEGMAAMLQRANLDKRALEVYRRALAIYPHQPDIEKIVDKLTLEVEGQGI